MSGNWQTIAGWFTAEQGETYKTLARGIKNGVIVEVGSYIGRSTAAIAEICIENGNKLICVDTWRGSENQQDGSPHCIVPTRDLMREFVLNMDKLGLMDVVHPIRTDSATAARMLKGVVEADMVFIDAEHDEESVLQDVALWSGVVKPGGILAGHDYDWESVQKGVERSGIKSISDFRDENYIWIARISGGAPKPCL